jgi:DNA mismatch repair protein MutS
MMHKIKSILFNTEVDSQIETINKEPIHGISTVTNHIYNVDSLETDCIIGDDVYNDLEIHYPYDNSDFSNTLIHKFTNAYTHGGNTFLKDIINAPQSKGELLNDRMTCIIKCGVYPKPEGLAPIVEIIKKHESDFLWFFSEREDTVNDLLDGVFFNSMIVSQLNKSETVLTGYNFYKMIISPILGVLSPLTYIILPFIILKMKIPNMKISFKTYIKLLYQSFKTSTDVLSILDNTSGGNGIMSKIQMATYLLSLLLYFQGMVNTYDVSCTTKKLTKFISDKMNGTVTYLKYTSKLIKQYEWIITDHYSAFLKSNALVDSLSNPGVLKIKEFADEYVPYEDFSVFSNFGKLLKFYKGVNKESVRWVANQFYFIDGILCIQRTQQEMKLEFPKIEAPNPNENANLKFKQLKHVLLKTCIPNDIDIRNGIITGPNAGGKSTIIKSIGTNVILAQTLCIVGCSEMSFVPFSFINTQINIPDCKGKESLFEAEMNRCMYNLKTVENMKSDQRSLIIMDEIFNSTNIVEAISGAYSILEKLASYPTVCNIITTHFLYLTKLKKHTSFECFCMNVIENEEDETKIHYPYIMKKGVSKQYVALSMLKRRGFDDSIIDKALLIKDKFVKRSCSK